MTSQCKELIHANFAILGTGFIQTSDPYVIFKIGKGQVRSSTVLKNLNPEVNSRLKFTSLNDATYRLKCVPVPTLDFEDIPKLTAAHSLKHTVE